MQQSGQNSSDTLMDSLIESAAQPVSTPFRERARRVGAVYTISYSSAIVAVYDYDREQAGGLPKSAFLIAAKPSGDETFILLRVQKEARLPAAAANDQTRQESIEDSGNQGPWSEQLPDWIRDKMSLHGLECSVLGTFLALESGGYRYAEDIDNYYSVSHLMAWKPDAKTLDLIVNHQHRTNDIPIGRTATKVGRTRFAAAERGNVAKADFKINPTDIMKRRTVYFGMSRSGKSNGIKIVAGSIYRLRQHNEKHRIGQIIFDLSGEYAQDNYQDGRGLHRVHETIGLDRDPEVATYGLDPVTWDEERTIMKLNFFGDPIPKTWESDQDTDNVELALDQLMAGKEIIKEIMANETARYTTAFRDVDLAVERSAAGNMSAKTRYFRAVLAYRTALAAAGLQVPDWPPTIQGPGPDSLFSKKLIAALKLEKNQNSDNKTDYHQASTILESAVQNHFRVTWDQLITVFTALSRFIEDKKSNFDSFEQDYITTSRSHESWADPRFRAVLRIFESRNGPRAFQAAQEQHDPTTNTDFAEAVVNDLKEGKLVIVDQSAGDPRHNKAAAERIMWQIFRSQQDLFRSILADFDPSARPDESQATKGHIIVYIEEAHNLLPRANASDNLTSVWARAAKEGSKLNIGMVLATQAPSSVMPEILSETDNWVLSYLNSEAERRVVAGYMDFSDFIEQIGKVSEQGFVRIRTLSQAYTVPVQLDKFEIKEAPPQLQQSDNGRS